MFAYGALAWGVGENILEELFMYVHHVKFYMSRIESKWSREIYSTSDRDS